MKKSILAILLVVFTVLLSHAEQPSTLFRFTTKQQADVVLKAISLEVNLPEGVFAQVRDLLYSSQQSQEEMAHKSENNSGPMLENIIRRQTMHIEENMKTIIGEEKFKLYLEKKSVIEKRVQQLPAKK